MSEIIVGKVTATEISLDGNNITTLNETDWKAGTNQTEALISPEKMTAANEEFRNNNDIGWNQTWEEVTGSRIVGNTYRNTTGSPITVNIHVRQGGSGSNNFEVSTDSTNWVRVARVIDTTNDYTTISIIVPNGHYYRLDGGIVQFWSELR